jgi:hypothetical protein
MRNVIDARTWEVRPLKVQPGAVRPAEARPRSATAGSTAPRPASRRPRPHARQESPYPEPERGICAVCGTAFDRSPSEGRSLCSELCAKRLHRRDRRRFAFGHFSSRVKWPHDLAWLAGKLGVPADDPRLPELALKLAAAGKLYVYIRRDGTVAEVGRPREFQDRKGAGDERRVARV